MSRKYCRACGEQRRLTWPKDKPEVCSKHCAAATFVFSAKTGDSTTGHCPWCGDPLWYFDGEHDEKECREEYEGGE